MFPTDPCNAIAQLPYLLDREPREVLMVAGFDAEGSILHNCSFRIDGTRPLDEPLLESSLWLNDVVLAAAVVYSDEQDLDLRPLANAWRYRGRTPLAVASAGGGTWRSFLCDATDCCPTTVHRYETSTPGHDPYAPLPGLEQRTPTWRGSRWTEWQRAITDAIEGRSIDLTLLHTLACTLHDIPIRDAVLAYSADAVADAQPGVAALLRAVVSRSTLGLAIPAHTCLAAMEYLSGDVEAARSRVQAILEVEEYSLARLLHNGLEMRAPGSLLARSFAHFTPQDLLAA